MSRNFMGAGDLRITVHSLWPSWLPGTLLVLFLCSAANAQQDRLPWEGPLPPERPRDIRQLLSTYGIGDEQLSLLVDQTALSDEQRRVVRRILFRLPQISRSALQALASDSWSPEHLVGDPVSYRGQGFSVHGVARRAEEVVVPHAATLRLEFEKYYRVALQVGSPAFPAVLYTRRVPQAWPIGVEMREPVRADGVFLKHGLSAESDELVFAAPRLEWYPERPNREWNLRDSHVALAQLGMDIGLLDNLRTLNRKPIGPADSECFYALLAAVGNAAPSLIRREAPASFDIAQLLQSPQTEHGQLVTLRGSLRRVTRILIDDLQVRERLGGDGYYQLDIFVPLGNQVIKFGKDQPGAQPTFADRYPVTVCTLTLPAGLPEGDELNREVRISGAFFKLWAYRSRFVSAIDESQLQVSPMLIGTEPVATGGPAPGPLPVVVGGGFLLILTAIWLLLWRSGRGDKRFAKHVLRRHGRT